MTPEEVDGVGAEDVVRVTRSLGTGKSPTTAKTTVLTQEAYMGFNVTLGKCRAEGPQGFFIRKPLRRSV